MSFSNSARELTNRRPWRCPCGKVVHGNGGKSSHRRACKVWNGTAEQVGLMTDEDRRILGGGF